MGTKIAFSTMTLNHKIPDDDPLWPKFNASFINVELETVDIANRIYLGHPFTTWHRNNWRHSANYQVGQHIGIDFDTEDRFSTLPYLAKDKFIQKYGALAYTTPSHQPEAPRARVLFFLDAPIHQAQNYTTAAAALLWLFGTADRKCKDACRFFYGSKDCEVEWFDNVLPLEKMKQIIHQHQEYQASIDRKPREQTLASTADQAEVAEALKKIPAWGIDYDQWLKVLMGIHSAFGDAGLTLAEQWAQGKKDEVVRKWRSFHQQGNPTGKATLNTVFKLAIEHGWRPAA